MSRDGKQVATGGAAIGETEIYVWDSETGRQNARLKVSATSNYGNARPYAYIESLQFTADGGKIIIVGSFNSRVTNVSHFTKEYARIIDISTGKTVRSLEVPTINGEAKSIDVSLDGRLFAIGGFYGGLTRVYDMTGSEIRTIKSPNSRGYSTHVAFSPDGHTLALTNSGNVEIWEINPGKLIRSLQVDNANSIVGIAWSPSGTEFATRGSNGLQIWSVKTWAPAKDVNLDLKPLGYGATVRYVPDGSKIIVAGSTLMLVDAQSLRPVKSFGVYFGGLLEGTDATSNEVMLVAQGCSIYTLNTVTGLIKKQFDWNDTRGPCLGAKVSVDGQKLAAYAGPGKVYFADTSIGHEIKSLRADAAGDASLSADGKTLAVKRGQGIDVMDTGSGTTIRALQSKPYAYALSPDGKTLVVGEIRYPPTVFIWDLLSGRSSQLAKYDVMAGGSQPSKFAFSPDGRFLIGVGTSSRHYSFEYWAVNNRQLLRRVNIPDDTTILFGGIAFHPDGDKILIGSADGKLRLWDLKSGALIRTYTGHVAEPFKATFAAGGTRIVSGGSDGVKIWNTETGNVLSSLYLTTGGEWLEITPDGFFARTKGAADLLSVVRGYEITTIGQVHQSLFSPDLVRESLVGDSDGKVREAARVINLEKVVDSGPAPDVAIISHPLESQSSDDVVTLQARITDRGKGIGRIEWRLNDVTAAVIAKPTGDGPDYVLTQQLALDAGENIVEVVAYNSSNLLASPPTRAAIKFTGSADTVKPTLHVLAIGINSYVDQGWLPPHSTEVVAFPPLSLAVNDAKALAAAFKQAGAGQYAEVKVTEALDSDASLTKLQEIIERVASEIHPRDTFVLFAAAHGTSHNGRFYLIPQDYDGGPNPSSLQERAIGQDRLQNWVANLIKAKKAILLLDTCESGALVGGYARSRVDVPSSEAAIGRLHEATGRPVLTAAAEGKPAFEGYEGHGVFTWALLDALKNGDRNGDGYIELSELVAHVQDQVPTIAAKLNGRGRAAVAARGSTDDRQTARFGSRGEDYALVRRLQ
jgi:WD40 repeat protein/uncharacterized caspase-like protein